MLIESKDPDLYTISRRIDLGDIDLQPDFQRDMVWNDKKKQGLIDTILRGWKFPPVYVVVPVVGERLDVLDGQQRLTAISDFFNDRIRVDGYIQPFDENIKKLDGLLYSELPQSVRARFDRYSIRIHELSDYNEEEPYELFFRLNQGSALTPAEKRNTLYGRTRDQVRELVLFMEEEKINVDRIGFNNNRLSYHDVVSRLLYALEKGSINRKITDSDLVDLFRNDEGISQKAYSRAKSSIIRISEALKKKRKLNKATLFTWLLFYSLEGGHDACCMLENFESLRDGYKKDKGLDPMMFFLMGLYQEKSSTSVNDATPVKLRLFVIYAVSLVQFGLSSASSQAGICSTALSYLEREKGLTEDSLLRCLDRAGWGKV